MKKLCLCAVALSLCGGPVWTQSTAELVNDGRNPDNVTTQSMGLHRRNYSPLAQINKSTVRRLVPVWSTSLMNDLGELSAPTVYDGVLYAINGKWTFAIEVATGKQLWRTPVELEPEIVKAGVLDASDAVPPRFAITRGAATIYDGKLFRVTVDNHIVALDMKTGRQVWNQRFADWREGYYATSAPIVANGVVISGMAGSESTTRGFLDGRDPETGRQLWRRYTIPAPGEPGSETWPKNSDAWMYGGGSTWRSGAYDPELDLVYWGVANAAPYDPRPRGELDSLYTSSVIAIKPRTGEIACFFQYTPNDVYDVDGNDEQVLADLQVGGRMRKVMIQANKNGFLYVLDRTNCGFIAAHPFVRVNWATQVAANGRPVLTELYKRFLAGEEVEIWPQRGNNAVPIAFNPNTGLVYTSSWNLPRVQRLAPAQARIIGGDATGVIGSTPVIEPGDVLGHLVAIDPLTGGKKWEIPLTDLPSSAGMLVTGGGLVFTGQLSGELVALDEQTGKTLWQFKTSSSINSTPITYTYKGRQYVTIASGLGGGVARSFAASRVPTGGSLWTFALMTE